MDKDICDINLDVLLNRDEYKDFFLNSETYIQNEIIKNKNMSHKSEEKNNHEANLLKKYFIEWLQVTKSNRRDLKKNNKDKQISDFLDKLLKEKEKLSQKNNLLNKMKTAITKENETDSITDLKSVPRKDNQAVAYGNYHHRFQAQKHIIALQNSILEQQKRYIEELKLNKIVKDASSIDTINEIKCTMSNCSISVKPKLKCVIRDTNTNESSSTEDLFRIDCMKIPKFLQKMEKRAREREEKREIVAERRRQIELERERIKEQKQMEKQLFDQDEREKRLYDFKEKRRQEQLIAIQQKKTRDKIRALMVMADLHYEKRLIFKYGITRWKLYVQKVKDDNATAIQFDKIRIVKWHFITWKRKARNYALEKNCKADNLYNGKLITRSFAQLVQNHKLMVNKRHTADDWYERRITDQFFAAWRIITKKQLKLREKQWELAVQHYNSQLMWKTIGLWEKLPVINKLEREHESRKQRWRLKVQQVLPDFMPKEY